MRLLTAIGFVLAVAATCVMRAVALIASVIWATNALAENWTLVPTPTGQSAEIAVDVDSIHLKFPGNTRFVGVSWNDRYPASSDTRRGRVDGIVDCNEFSITNHTYSLGTNPLSKTHEEWVLDLATGKGNHQVESMKSSCAICDSTRFQYPSWSSSAGFLIRNVCPRFQPDWKEKWLAPLDADLCRSPPSAYMRRACASDSEEAGDLNVSVHRIAKMKASGCAISDEAFGRIFNYYLLKADNCKIANAQKCIGLFPVTEMESSLRRLANGEACNFAAEQLEKIEKDEKKTKAQQSAADTAKKCAHAAIIRLDDGLSPANILVTAILATCSNENRAWWEANSIVPFEEARGTLEHALMPKLIKDVLELRAANRQSRDAKKDTQQAKPTKPKKLEM